MSVNRSSESRRDFRPLIDGTCEVHQLHPKLTNELTLVSYKMGTKTFIPDTQHRRGISETLGEFRYMTISSVEPQQQQQQHKPLRRWLRF